MAIDTGKRDKTILLKILKYCNDIDKTNEHFGCSKSKLKTDSIYMNALSMKILSEIIMRESENLNSYQMILPVGGQDA
jgi:hypothetical protein